MSSIDVQFAPKDGTEYDESGWPRNLIGDGFSVLRNPELKAHASPLTPDTKKKVTEWTEDGGYSIIVYDLGGGIFEVLRQEKDNHFDHCVLHDEDTLIRRIVQLDHELDKSRTRARILRRRGDLLAGSNRKLGEELEDTRNKLHVSRMAGVMDHANAVILEIKRDHTKELEDAYDKGVGAGAAQGCVVAAEYVRSQRSQAAEIARADEREKVTALFEFYPQSRAVNEARKDEREKIAQFIESNSSRLPHAHNPSHVADAIRRGEHEEKS